VLTAPVRVRDLNSTNGTLINGARITEAELSDGTALQLGGTTLVFRSG
jgi:pSer/pThr/pTyr-binding forkhead associated (FHA) protein